MDSTNRYAKENAGKEPLLVRAEFQTAGRGSGTNTWESEAGKNLTFSIADFPAKLLANKMFVISEVTALALHDTLSMYAEGFSIKWPNDIYHHDCKICGMLIENDLTGKLVKRTVIGIGLNVNQRKFRSDAPNPVSLAQILGKEVEREEVINRFLNSFGRRWQQMEDGKHDALHQEYLSHLFRKDEQHQFSDANGTFNATLTNVEPTGHLVLRDTSNHLRRYEFKEVKFVHQYNTYTGSCES